MCGCVGCVWKDFDRSFVDFQFYSFLDYNWPHDDFFLDISVSSHSLSAAELCSCDSKIK